jgi:hypothetical protein
MPAVITRSATAAVNILILIDSPSLIEVALHAKIRGRIEMGERRERRSVRAVTTETVDAQVGVARVNHLLAYRVARVLLPVVAVAAQSPEIVLLHEEQVVRRVRFVTTGAFPFVSRGVLDPGRFELFEGIGVTGGA